jgi:hypothetical protein
MSLPESGFAGESKEWKYGSEMADFRIDRIE